MLLLAGTVAGLMRFVVFGRFPEVLFRWGTHLFVPCARQWLDAIGVRLPPAALGFNNQIIERNEEGVSREDS